MVDRGSKRVNTVQRLLLVGGIIAIGVLDVTFTSYLNGLDADPVAKSVAQTNLRPASPPVASDQFEQEATKDELTTTAETSDSSSSRSDSSHRYLKASFWALKNKRAGHKHSISSRGLVASAATSVGCQVISYPFIGTGVYVQVTDSTGCLTGDSPRNKRGNLLAKTMPTSVKRWKALNTLVAKLK